MSCKLKDSSPLVANEGQEGVLTDSMKFTYTGNRLTGFYDKQGDIASVVDYPGSATSKYPTYDYNGNETTEPHKQLGIGYNMLNLPYVINWNGLNRKVSYFYTFDGVKRRKTVEDNGTITKVDYCGPFVYETVSGTRSLKYIITPHGRAVKSGSSWVYNYNITDHLGNVRAEITPYIGGAPLVTQARNYYTFGMEMSQLNNGTTANKYQYNGKEIQDDFGLYWYDYGARFYDPMVGRWHTIDPKAELARRWSPYAYGFDNPILFLDPDGMEGLPYMEKRDRRTATNANSAFVWNVGAEIYNGVAGTVNLISDAITNPESVPSGAEIARGAAESLQNIDLGNPDTQEKIVAGAVTIAAGELLMTGKASGALKGTEMVDNTVEITVSRNKFPQAAQHIDDAAGNGVSTTGTIDRAGASARRSAAIRSTPTRSGMDRDEVPPAVINNGGNGSSVRHIDMKDNRGAGGSIGQQIKKLPDGTPVKIVTK